MKSSTEYKIRTPTGVYDDINDVISDYPYLSHHNKINECPFCGKYFIKYSKNDINRKYCSIECSKEYTRIYKNILNSARNRDKYLREKNKQIISDKLNINPEYHQNDNFWGLGNSNLSEHKSDNWLKERNTIKKELRRIGL